MFLDCKLAETVSSGISTVVVPGRTVCLISGQLYGEPISQGGVLIEQSQGTPTNLCIGRTLSSVTNGGEVTSQIMNISPTQITIYKGTTLGTATPSQLVMLLGIDEDLGQNTLVSSNEFHIDCENMSTTELRRLLNKFSSLFVSVEGAFGQATQVKHSISKQQDLPYGSHYIDYLKH